MFSPMLAVPCFQNINPKHLAGCGLAGGWSLHLATGLIAGAFQIVQALKPITSITMMRVRVRVARGWHTSSISFHKMSDIVLLP